jgi:hypothetical protein
VPRPVTYNLANPQMKSWRIPEGSVAYLLKSGIDCCLCPRDSQYVGKSKRIHESLRRSHGEGNLGRGLVGQTWRGCR